MSTLTNSNVKFFGSQLILCKLLLLFQGVESERCPSFKASIEAGKPIYTKACSTLADGLAVPLVGVNALATAKPLIDKMVTVR